MPHTSCSLLLQKILAMYALFGCYSAPSQVLTASLLFSHMWCQSWNLWSLSGLQIWPNFCVCSLLICQSPLLLLWNSTWTAGRTVQCGWEWSKQSTGVPVDQLKGSWVRHFQKFMGGLLDGIHNAVDWMEYTIQESTMFSRSSSYHCSCILLSPSHVAHSSVLCVVWETNQALWKHPMQFRKLDVHSYTLPFPHGINHEPRKMFLGTKMWCLAGRVIWVT